MASLLSNPNLAEGIHKIKCKYVHDNRKIHLITDDGLYD